MSASEKILPFTPGPWRVEMDPYPHLRTVHGDVCVWARDHSREEDRNLADSAPDLLAALEDVQGEIEGRYDGAVDSNTLWLGRSLEIIDKAIAKARGLDLPQPIQASVMDELDASIAMLEQFGAGGEER